MSGKVKIVYNSEIFIYLHNENQTNLKFPDRVVFAHDFALIILPCFFGTRDCQSPWTVTARQNRDAPSRSRPACEPPPPVHNQTRPLVTFIEQHQVSSFYCTAHKNQDKKTIFTIIIIMASSAAASSGPSLAASTASTTTTATTTAVGSNAAAASSTTSSDDSNNSKKSSSDNSGGGGKEQVGVLTVRVNWAPLVGTKVLLYQGSSYDTTTAVVLLLLSKQLHSPPPR